MGRVCQFASIMKAQTHNIKLQSRSNRLHHIPPSLLLSIASTLSPLIIIKNGQSETNSPQNN
jgi:hypothetical protein